MQKEKESALTTKYWYLTPIKLGRGTKKSYPSLAIWQELFKGELDRMRKEVTV